MTSLLTFSLGIFTLGLAVLAGMAASARLSAGRTPLDRLRAVTSPAGGSAPAVSLPLTEAPIPSFWKLSRALPASPREMSKLRRQMVQAGFYDVRAAVFYSAAKWGGPVVLAGIALALFGIADGWLIAAVLAPAGYVLPDLVLMRAMASHARAIQNGLPDALDLLIVCIEGGSGLDQAILKAGEELALTHPALSRELGIVTTEIRAGMPRIDAFRNFARRTQVDDVRGLIAMLNQTDRFGTSVAQALRIHAEVSRTRRRQRVEERAAKVGVKLVFPLVLCIFPAVYLVCIGPAMLAIYHALFQ